jgi:hypothetical protein
MSRTGCPLPPTWVSYRQALRMFVRGATVPTATRRYLFEVCVSRRFLARAGWSCSG